MPLAFDVGKHSPRQSVAEIPRIRFLVTADFPPFSFIDMAGRLSGFNVDLARELCRELKVENRCQLQAMPFSELEGALSAGQGDAVIAGVAPSSALRERFAFSRTYLPLPTRFVVNKERIANIARPSDLADQKVGVVDSSASEAMLKAFFPDLKTTQFQEQSAMLAALKKGEIDAVFANGLHLAFWLDSKDSDGCCKRMGEAYYSRYFLGEGMTVMTRQPTALSAALDSALAALAEKGKLNEIYLKYFPAGL